jgi:2,3-bisphosphoglycerate-dependent phosphoglycerate mutase
MRLYFVRHGESEANLAKVFSNRGFQHPLTPKGITQAEALAVQLAGHQITQIYSSPLLRAVQTAEILAQACAAPVAITDALREWDVGIFEGTHDPRGWELHRQVQEDWFVHKLLDHSMPEGESFLDIQARFVPFIRQLVQAQACASDAVALVGHGGLYHAMLPGLLQNISYDLMMRYPFANTAYALAESGPDGLFCREWCGAKIRD